MFALFKKRRKYLILTIQDRIASTSLSYLLKMQTITCIWMQNTDRDTKRM